MHISARVRNAPGTHDVNVTTEGVSKALTIPCRPEGVGSSVNGGELLMLALATCYCNDLYREASRLGIGIDSCEVEAVGDFEGVGLAAKNIRYRAQVVSSASVAEVTRLLQETDAVAEVHNTLRAGVVVQREA